MSVQYRKYDWSFDAVGFGNAIHAARTDQKATITETAEILGVARTTLISWENGIKGAPLPSNFINIINLFDLDPRDFWCLSDTGKSK